MDDLVGSTEIAKRLKLSHAETVHNWRHRYPDFPEPVARLRIGMVWAWPEIQRWAKATGRLPA